MAKILFLILSLVMVIQPHLLLAEEAGAKSGGSPEVRGEKSPSGGGASQPGVSASEKEKDALVSDLYLKSGLKKQLEMFPVTSKAALGGALVRDPRIRDMPADLVAAMTGTIDRAFSEGELKGIVLKDLGEKLTVPEIREALEWLDSPLGRRITLMEEMASTPAGYFGTERYAEELKTKPPAIVRLGLVGRLDKAIKATDSNVDMMLSMQAALAMAMFSALPAEHEMPFESLLKEMAKAKPALEAEMHSQVQIGMLYTYRDLTNGELEKYIGFVTSPSGQKYQSAMTAATKKAFISGGVRWGEAIADMAKRKKGISGT